MNSTLNSELAELVAKAELSNFVPKNASYVALSDQDQEVRVVPIAHIEVFERGPGVANFGLERALAVLKGIRDGSALPPIEVHALEQNDRYTLYDGFHRYHLSRFLGFRCIPITVIPRVYL
jgi:hypothetical protein